jgi:tetratricopeptide (TPR) repeat protein
MFGRWLKPKRGATDALDLRHHSPEEFPGKTLTLDGREYVVGERIRTSDQGYAHRLINRLSGLCLHVIQIRCEYMRDPASAWTASKTMESMTAQLRDKHRTEGSGDPVVLLTAHQGHGGSFELHEIPCGMFAEWSASPADEPIKAASDLANRGDHAAAIEMLQGVLSRHPHHTVGLNNLAASYDAQGQAVAALDAMRRAVEVEPNSSFYRGGLVALSLNCPRRREASVYFEELEQRYPHVRDYDYYGIHAYLRIGRPDRAREILLRGTLPAAQVEMLETAVEAAVRARRQFAELDGRLVESRFADLEEPATLRQLEEMHAGCDVDPLLQANLGFRLQAAGQYQRAVQLLLGAAGGIEDNLVLCCHANAAYSLLAQSSWKSAMRILTVTMDALTEVHKVVQPADVPGLVLWIRENGLVMESKQPSAADLLDGALRKCPDRGLLTPQVLRMNALLKKFSASLSSGT